MVEAEIVDKLSKRTNVLFDTTSFGVLLAVVEVDCAEDGLIEVRFGTKVFVLPIVTVVQLRLYSLRPDGSHVIR